MLPGINITDNNNQSDQPAIIKIVGVGGGGNNAVNKMMAEGITGVEFIGINTDLQVLRKCKAPRKIEIGEKISGGKGVGGDPEIGRQAAEENVESIRGAIVGADMVIVTAGMGGGTGTGAAPVVAQIAKEEGCLTVGVVTTPFKFEERDDPAKKGIENLKPWTDSLIVVSNEKVFSIESLSIDNMYNIVDDVLRRSVQAITDVITRTGEINRDFNDVKVVLKDSGTAIVGWGECLDSEDWIEAFNKAVKNNLIESYDISRAKKMLVVLTTPHNVEAIKIQKLFDSIPKSYNSEKRKVLFGHVYEDRLDNKIRLVVIGADFKNQSISRPVIKSHKKEKNEKTEKDNTIDNPQPDLPSLSPQNKTDIKFNEPAYIEWKPTGRLDRK